MAGYIFIPPTQYNFARNGRAGGLGQLKIDLPRLPRLPRSIPSPRRLPIGHGT
jgi:hypothetical protein